MKMLEHIYQLSHKNGESMVGLGNRKHELYHKLQRALLRIRPGAAATDETDERERSETEFCGALLLYNSGLSPTKRAGALAATVYQCAERRSRKP